MSPKGSTVTFRNLVKDISKATMSNSSFKQKQTKVLYCNVLYKILADAMHNLKNGENEFTKSKEYDVNKYTFSQKYERSRSRKHVSYNQITLLGIETAKKYVIYLTSSKAK